MNPDLAAIDRELRALDKAYDRAIATGAPRDKIIADQHAAVIRRVEIVKRMKDSRKTP